jgi:hypothetical protein
MGDQVQDEAAVSEPAESTANDGTAERYSLGIKQVDNAVYKIDAGVRKIDAGVRRISKEIHKVTDKTQ